MLPNGWEVDVVVAVGGPGARVHENRRERRPRREPERPREKNIAAPDDEIARCAPNCRHDDAPSEIRTWRSFPDRAAGVNRVAGFGNDRVVDTARSDAEVIARASGHPEHFGIIFDRHFATIHRYLERRIGRDGADELAGDVFLTAFAQRDRFRPLHESALPWLYGLASNLLLKHWRSERRHLHSLSRFGDERGMHVAQLDEIHDRLTARAVHTATSRGACIPPPARP